MSTATANGRRVVVTAPVTGRGDLSLLAIIPVWIGSAVIHGALLALAYFVFGMFESTAKANDAPPEATKTTEVEDPPKEVDLTNTDIGIDDSVKLNYDLDRIEDVSVPGPVDPTAPVGIVNAPEDAVRGNVPLPPGVGGGTGAAPLLADGPTIGSMVGTPGGMGGAYLIGAFQGRSGATRERMLTEGGGNRLSEAAVARSLQWLAMHQSQEGRWGLHDFNRCAREKPYPAGAMKTCNCDGASTRRNDIAATGFALLPFLASGITHKNANSKSVQVDYTKTVEAGLFWLMKKQAADGSFSGEMYSHGIASIAICEAYGLSNDPRLKLSAQKAVNFIVSAQDNAGGGWRYAPKTPGDTSVTGWQLMALKSAQMAGLNVPRQTLTLCERFLDSVEDSNKGRYKYTADSGPTPVMSSVALLCRQYLGVNPRNPGLIKGCEYLVQSAMPGTSNNIYYEYYATQVLHHMGGDTWKIWNEGKDGKPGIRDYLIHRQEQNKGNRQHIEGSFPVTDVYGGEGGRVMITALSVLCLEVYYRHLPLYRRDLGVMKP
jgi:hypothetical protein